MSQPTEVQVVPTPILLAGLTNLMASGGPFHALTLGLYKNNVALNRNTVIGSLTPADFDGYTPQASFVFSAPYIDVDGTALAIGASTAFIATGSTTPNQIYGYYFADSGLTALKAAYALQTPVGIALSGQAVTVVPFLRYSGT